MSSVNEGRAPAAEAPEALAPSAIEKNAGSSRLLMRLYRDIGLAAVATELQINARVLPTELAAAIDRGAPLLKSKDSELAA